MNSTLYMGELSLQPSSSFSSERAVSNNLAIILEGLSIFFNLFTFYLVKRQGFKTFDMWIASFLSIGDAIFIGYKFCQSIAYNILGFEKIFLNVYYGQYDGLIEVFFVLFSVSCVGYLALLRYWVIYLKKNLKVRIWVVMFILLQFVHLSLLISVLVNMDFILMPLQLYFFPNTISIIPLTRFTACYTIFFSFICLCLVNFCYFLLAKRFIHILEDNIDNGFNDSFYTLTSCLKKQKRSTYIKTGIILLLYSLCVVPYLVISIREQILMQLRTRVEDSIIAVCVMLFTVVNPMMLMILHDDIYMDLKLMSNSIFEKFKKKERKFTYNYSP
ncbi:hypothetical protein K502DRAFT_367312 [Neoconidiobolus thromboides FSU 785]|nr:hypothetical protein K502DRAFT_367312 [Neoconidiobolus thromboides FSU 785]